jgi:hypothetical protein
MGVAIEIFGLEMGEHLNETAVIDVIQRHRAS